MHSANVIQLFPAAREEKQLERTRGIRMSLRYLEQEAADAGFAELAMLIGVAALAAQDMEDTDRS